MTEHAQLGPEAFVADVPDVELQRLLATQPLSRLEMPDGKIAWNLVRATDVARALARLDYFATPDVDEEVSDFPGPWSVSAMMTLAPPDHAPARRECAPLVEAPRLDALRPALRSMATRRVSAVEGRIDFVEDVAAPLAAHMGAAYLGLAPENYEYFRRLSAVFMADTLPPRAVGGPSRAVLGPLARGAASGSPAQAAVELIRESFTGSPWAEAPIVETLSRSAVEDWGMQFVTAGTGGTRACLTYAVQLLADGWPAWRQQIQKDPGLVTGVANEVIRLASPLLRVRRILTRQIELHGSVLPVGATVLLWLVAANRDPGVFPQPVRFDPWRPVRRNFSFGGGPHHCLGHPIATMEVEEFLRAALEQWASVEVLGQAVRPASNVVNEIAALPVRVSRQSSQGT